MLKRFFIFSGLAIFVFLSSAQDRQFATPLPLVFIDTDGKPVPDNPKIMARMGIIWDEEGKLNNTRDTFNHYNGFIAIETRGSSSQSFPKKSYGFETLDSLGEDMDFPLLGLPQEEDWIFYGPYSDKSLIRNALAFTLAQSLGHYASRNRFVELFLNKKYQGVYLLMEKIKRDSVRVDINNLKPGETEGKDLTGGYIIKIDKTTGSGGSGWQSQYFNRNGNKTFYQYEVPAADEIAAEQKQYIHKYLDEFEKALINRKYNGAGSYNEYIDVPTFIDYILLNELSKNVDAYRLSTFLHKDKGGKLKAGPVWDFNLAFGNAEYHNAWLTTGFQIDARLEGDQWGNPFWWKGLWGDTAFVNDMKCRWMSLRKESWSTEQIIAKADSLVNLLDDAAVRNFERWPVMGHYVWPNYYIATNHNDEINWMKNWLRHRLAWIDSHLPGNCGGTIPPTSKELQVSIFPNPVRTKISLHVISGTNLNLDFQLYNINGSIVIERQVSVAGGEQTLQIDAENLPKGIYLYHLYKGPELFQKGKLVKF